MEGSLVVYDVGNTRTKCGYFVEPPPPGEYAAPTSRASWPTGELPLHAATTPSRVVIGSVVPAAVEGLMASLPRDWPDADVVTPEQFGLTLDVDEPQAVGVDRVANAAAIFAITGETSMVVDAGTAATVDAVVLRGGRPTFVGGAILPGLRLMALSLTELTARLPAIDPTAATPELPGRNTRDAIAAGVSVGFRGALMQVVARMQQATECTDENVAIEGGDLPTIGEWFPHSRYREGGLTLSGLAMSR